jgi:hypothetical protein
VRDALAHILRVITAQSRRNLLRRPAVSQAPVNVVAQPATSQFSPSTWRSRSLLGTPLRGGGQVALGTRSIAPQLAAHGRGTPTESACNRPDRASRRHPAADFLTFHGTQMDVALFHGNTSVTLDTGVALVV